MAHKVNIGGPSVRDAAFVVHLARGDAVSDEHARGRVEHVRTGRMAHFDSAEELLNFMRQTLAALDHEPPSPV